jgi:hypothetical protein
MSYQWGEDLDIMVEPSLSTSRFVASPVTTFFLNDPLLAMVSCIKIVVLYSKYTMFNGTCKMFNKLYIKRMIR